MPSDEEIRVMEEEARPLLENSSLDNCPVSKAWVQRVFKWFEDLGREAEVDHKKIYMRFRQCLHRWKAFVKYLPQTLAKQLISIIEKGYGIPWDPAVDPSRLAHDCKRNPPIMKTRVDDTWKIFEKTLQLGAIEPFDTTEGLPPVVCPVFFIDEVDKLRVVHNLKWPNARMDKNAFSVWLETLQRIRGIFPLLG